jgi:hypothetical protein
MNDIFWIYIIDNTGAIMFKYETTLQKSLKNSSAVLSNFLKNLEFIAMNLRKNEIRGVEMGNHKYFITRENHPKYLFIIKTGRDADGGYIRQILNQIRQRFVEKFDENMVLAVEEKIEILDSFKEDVNVIINPKNDHKNLANPLN